MHPDVAEAPDDQLGLRERKKAATRQALHEAAVRLAIAHGAEKVTVEAIADAVEVSRRTFSNYFANKEEALLYGDQVRMRHLLHLVRSQPAGTTPWAALTDSADELYRTLGNPNAEWISRNRLIHSHPALVAQQVATYALLERDLATALAERLDDAENPGLRARTMAAVFLAAMRVAVRLWLEQPAGAIALPAMVQQTLAEAARPFA